MDVNSKAGWLAIYIFYEHTQNLIAAITYGQISAGTSLNVHNTAVN